MELQEYTCKNRYNSDHKVDLQVSTSRRIISSTNHTALHTKGAAPGRLHHRGNVLAVRELRTAPAIHMIAPAHVLDVAATARASSVVPAGRKLVHFGIFVAVFVGPHGQVLPARDAWMCSRARETNLQIALGTVDLAVVGSWDGSSVDAFRAFFAWAINASTHKSTVYGFSKTIPHKQKYIHLPEHQVNSSFLFPRLNILRCSCFREYLSTQVLVDFLVAAFDWHHCSVFKSASEHIGQALSTVRMLARTHVIVLLPDTGAGGAVFRLLFRTRSAHPAIQPQEIFR
jgi:hypothetical protein